LSIKNKVTAVIAVIAFTIVFFSYNAFENFFHGYLAEQEDAHIDTVIRSIRSYFDEKESKYLGSVNDWGHWNDTYYFVAGAGPNYIRDNLTTGTFYHLDLSFAVVVDADRSIQYRQFYDRTSDAFVEFPAGVFEDLAGVILPAPTAGDMSGILPLGDRFFFVASSDITPSNAYAETNGRFYFGRELDNGVIGELEAITGGHITLAGTDAGSILPPARLDGANTRLLQSAPAKAADTASLMLSVIGPGATADLPLMTVDVPRNIYTGGKVQLRNFEMIYILTLVLLAFLLYLSLSHFISRPLFILTEEMKSIDLTENRLHRLPEFGRDEIAFLRKSVNDLLRRIELGQGRLRENEEKLSATLTSVGEGIIAVNESGNIDFINPAARQLTGWTQEEAYEKPFASVLRFVSEYTGKELDNPVRIAFATGATVEPLSHTLLLAKDGTEIAVEVTAAPIKDKLGSIIGVVVAVRDFREKKEKSRQIEYLSYHDQLTGLFNRRFFEEELKRLDSGRNLPLSLVFADVNGLKTVNDAFGHTCGDKMICQVTAALRAECCSDDIIARTGGDEFIILLPGCAPDKAKNLVKRIKTRLAEEKFMAMDLSVSFGWAAKVTPEQSVWTVLKDAEDFMYRKKILDNASKRSAVIRSILHTLHLKSPREDAHSKRVSLLCEAIGRAFGLNEDEIRELRIAGELHDIGKIAVDEVILTKPGTLSATEWEQMHRHPETGFRLLGTASEYYGIAEYVLAHHERWDGAGYPKGLKDKEIPWKARVVNLADAYDAMTSGRPYREPLSQTEALAEIKMNAGKQFDPEIVQVFAEKVIGDGIR